MEIEITPDELEVAIIALQAMFVSNHGGTMRRYPDGEIPLYEECDNLASKLRAIRSLADAKAGKFIEREI